MPKEVKAYSCEFGCRRKVLTSKADMARHEENCFHNPVRRACASCKHLLKEHDDNGMDEPYFERWVNVICLGSDLIDIQEKLTFNCGLYREKN